MKNLFVIALMLLSSLFTFASEKEKIVSAGIDHVTLFYSGAQIERSSKSFTLEKGQTILKVQGLEQYLLENSIRVGLTGSGKILSVVKRIDYAGKSSASQEIAALEKKLKGIEEEKEEVRLNSRVYEQEKTLLMSNIKLGSEQQGVQIAELKEAADFYRTRLSEIETKLLLNSRKIVGLEEEIVKIRRQLTELNYKKNRPSSSLEITAEMPSDGSTRVIIDYYIPNARWMPQYDIRVNEVGKPVSVVRKAAAAQSSGVDWNNVKITFSTGNPQDRASKPNLHPWYLRQYSPQPEIQIRGAASRAPAAKEMNSKTMVAVEDEIEMDMGFALDASRPDVEMGTKNSLLEFKLASPASIPSDNKDYNLVIGALELDAKYEYHTVPKLDPSAYLMAMVSDWNKYELINGAANIYYEGMFVGETFIMGSSTMDTMQISLGKDKGITVERKQIQEFSARRVIGSNIKREFGYNTVVRNGKPEAVVIIIEDNYPISTLKDVEVTQEEHGTGVVDKQSGKVRWKKTVPAGESLSIPFRYSVKYPSDMQINL